MRKGLGCRILEMTLDRLSRGVFGMSHAAMSAQLSSEESGGEQTAKSQRRGSRNSTFRGRTRRIQVLPHSLAARHSAQGQFLPL